MGSIGDPSCIKVLSEPYAWPCVGKLDPSTTAFIIIDMQVGMRDA